MATFTVEQLATILRDGAGEAEPIVWTDETVGQTFEDLGYDSIALLETASRVQQLLGIKLEDSIAELRTPAEFIDHVNQLCRD